MQRRLETREERDKSHTGAADIAAADAPSQGDQTVGKSILDQGEGGYR